MSGVPQMEAGAPTALIADDESLLIDALRRELALVWPALRIVATVGDGRGAIERIRALQPDVAFLDISMPGATGLEVARACAPLARPPAIVFVTAYDEHALAAFDAAAVDYLLKPLETARLARTVARLGERLAGRAADPLAQPALERLLARLEPRVSAPPLRFLRAAQGETVRLVPVDDVLYLEAADKYVAVTTRDEALWIRASLRELLAQLDPARFWQVHRGTVVNVDHVESARVNGFGKMTLTLRAHAATVAVSRQYAHLFRQM
jgi:DNA-binding LytR/AlgR family response regulator